MPQEPSRSLALATHLLQIESLDDEVDQPSCRDDFPDDLLVRDGGRDGGIGKSRIDDLLLIGVGGTEIRPRTFPLIWTANVMVSSAINFSS